MTLLSALFYSLIAWPSKDISCDYRMKNYWQNPPASGENCLRNFQIILRWKKADNDRSLYGLYRVSRSPQRNTDLAAKRATGHRQKFSRTKFLALVLKEERRGARFRARSYLHDVAKMWLELWPLSPRWTTADRFILPVRNYRYPCTCTRSHTLIHTVGSKIESITKIFKKNIFYC